MPRAAEIRAAAAMPMLTASPCDAHGLLDGVSQGMTEIELPSFARFQASAPTKPDFIRTDLSNAPCDGPPVQGKKGSRLSFEKREQVLASRSGSV